MSDTSTGPAANLPQPPGGFYADRIFPWLNDRLARDEELERLRGETLAAARGRVVEIGFGSGLNLRHYPDAVRAIVAVEPNAGMHRRAAGRIEASRIPVEVIKGTAENMPLPDGAFDTAVSVLTLCSVAEPARVLSELRRVLRDDGTLLLMEHGLAGDPGVARWQNRLNGIQRVVGCGCNLNRRIGELVQAHGFRFESVRRFYAPNIPRTHGWFTVGMAVKA
jgi:ubiquinone/menaquinone biosynthesis C-methylase UbiE